MKEDVESISKGLEDSEERENTFGRLSGPKEDASVESELQIWMVECIQ